MVKRDAEIHARRLYNAYKRWANETEEWVVNERQFSQNLSERDGLQKVKHASGNMWKGIELTAERHDSVEEGKDGLTF